MRRTTGARFGVAIAVGVTLAGATVALHGLGAGQSFLFLQSGYDQELYGATQLPADDDGFATVLGGVAFAPDGDPWVAECLFARTKLHRFDAQTLRPETNLTTTLHPETIVETEGGCGLTNHPDGSLYSNSIAGVYRLNASTGLPIPWPDLAANPRGVPGNGLGITADPRTGHVVYVGADCHLTLVPGATTCTIHALNPADGAVTTFAQLNHAEVPFVDGIYFDPTGDFLFLSNRGDTPGIHFLTILRRPEDSFPHTGNPQLVQSVLTGSEPDGVAFHAGTPRFVITNDEENGTMTKFEFPGDDYTQTPIQTVFASGGFRGDLLNVGPDGCIYATQGRDALATDPGTRYDDGTVTTEDSLVRICAAGGGGFVPGPGVRETAGGTGGRCASSIGDFVWNDLDGDGIQDADEPGLDGVTVSLAQGGTTVATDTTKAGGFYRFTDLCAGTYTVEAVTPANFVPTVSLAGNDRAIDSDGSPAEVVVPADATITTIDFGFVSRCTGAIGDLVWKDVNRDGIQDPGEPGIPDVRLRLRRQATAEVLAETVTDQHGFYQFTDRCAGEYLVEVATPASFQPTKSGQGSDPGRDSNSSPAPVGLTAGNASNQTIDFGFVQGTLMCPAGASPAAGAAGILIVFTEPNGDVLVRYVQSLALNDNSYGINAIGWLKGHSFSNLTGSDKAQFVFRDAGGKVVLDFLLDYISRKTGVPSGHGSLGVTGGDGRLNVGRAEHVISYRTSLDHNLNAIGLCAGGTCTVNGVNLLLDSPPASPTYQVFDPVFGQWDFSSWYEVRISGAAFGAAGFGSVALGEVHNSPAKTGSNAVSPVPCPGETPPPPEPCRECSGGVTSLTLRYKGTSPAGVVVRAENGDTVFSGVVPPEGSFSIQGTEADRRLGAAIAIEVNGAAHTTIDTSCAQPIGPGLVRGAFEVVSGGSRDGGVLCPLPPPPACAACKGGVTDLELRYKGPGPARVEVYQSKKPKAKLFEGVVETGGLVTFTGAGKNLTMGSEISIRVNGVQHTTMHTSCSQPIGPGLVRGDFEVVSGRSKDGGALCPVPAAGAGNACTSGVKPRVLIMEYTGESCTTTQHTQASGKVACAGSAALGPDVHIVADDGGTRTWFRGAVSVNETFEINAGSVAGATRLGTNTYVSVTDDQGLLLQAIQFHTSCSQPLNVGDRYGALRLVGLVPE